MTKELVLEQLWQNADRYVSGTELARRLQLSRSAVWKAIEQLRVEGYRIESVTNRGYRLSSRSDVLSVEGLRRCLRHRDIEPRVYKSISSTNTVLKDLANQGAAEGLALIAGEQTAGRGRMGRSFYSPADTGVYMSLLLRPERSAAEATRLTACAAVAAAQAIEMLSGRETQIKWVNDILMDGRKVCGILSEASIDCESGQMRYVIVGIGINTRLPAADFPEELRDTAGAVFPQARPPELRCRLAAAVLDGLMDLYEQGDDETCFVEYKKRSLVLGQPVLLLSPGKDAVPATVLDLERDYALRVRYEDGSIHRINAGEVSLRQYLHT